MGLELEYLDGQTPIDEDEKEGLLIPHITLQGELDEFEQRNIQKAQEWILKNTFNQKQILSDDFIKGLHKQMYGDVWKWAGTFRKSNKNIGVDWPNIAVDVKLLLDNCSFWIEKETYMPDEIAIRFKHGLVSIHCFPNGNGRHSRLMGDIIINQIFQNEMFTWGGSSIQRNQDIRKGYIDSVKKADEGDHSPLIKFARS